MVTNTLAYYKTATIKAVKLFIVQDARLITTVKSFEVKALAETKFEKHFR